MERKKSTLKQLPPHPINLRFHFLKKKTLPTGPYIFAIIPSGNNRLKLDSVDTFVSTVKQPLVDSAGSTNWANCPINKSKTVIKWGSFSVNNFGKSFKIGLA